MSVIESLLINPLPFFQLSGPAGRRYPAAGAPVEPVVGEKNRPLRDYSQTSVYNGPFKRASFFWNSLTDYD